MKYGMAVRIVKRGDGESVKIESVFCPEQRD